LGEVSKAASICFMIGKLSAVITKLKPETKGERRLQRAGCKEEADRMTGVGVDGAEMQKGRESRRGGHITWGNVSC